MIYCENIIKILETWLFSFKLDDFTSHDIITAPLDLLKKLSLENLKLPVFPFKKSEDSIRVFDGISCFLTPILAHKLSF